MSCGRSATATVLFDTCAATISVVNVSKSFALEFSDILCEVLGSTAAADIGLWSMASTNDSAISSRGRAHRTWAFLPLGVGRENYSKVEVNRDCAPGEVGERGG